MHQDEQWHGEERRGLPIHVLNWIKEEVRGANETMSKLLESHTEDEMDRYDQIISQMKINDQKSEERHDETQSIVNDNHKRIEALQQSISSFITGTSEFHDAIKRAFPKDEDGKPDYDGHRTAHLGWIRDAKDDKELMTFLKQVKAEKDDWRKTWGHIKLGLFAAAAVASMNFAFPAIWTAFLGGPK